MDQGSQGSPQGLGARETVAAFPLTCEVLSAVTPDAVPCSLFLGKEANEGQLSLS